MSDDGSTKNQFRPLSVENTELDFWSERDRLHISLRNLRSGKIVFEAWDEDVQQLFEDGFLSDAGFSMGRLIQPKKLHESLVKYYRHLHPLKSKAPNPRVAYHT